MSLRRIRGVEWGRFKIVLGDRGGWVGMQNLVLVSRSQLTFIQSPEVPLDLPS